MRPKLLNKISLYLGISILWLALSMLFDGLNTLVLPARISTFVGQAHQASMFGLLSFAGLLAGMLVQPIAGAASDRLRYKIGRMGFLMVGIMLTLIFMALFGMAGTLVVFISGYLLIQVSASLTQAAQQGFIPDLVPASDRGKASGWKAFMDIGGAMVGFVLLGHFLSRGRAGFAILAIGFVLVAAFILTVLLVRERQASNGIAREDKFQPVFVFTSAYRLDLKKHRSFTWLVASRFFFLLGIYAVGRFLLYFVASRLGLAQDEAATRAGSLLAGLALTTVLAVPFAGWASDRLGRIPVILFGSLISALGILLLIFASSLGQIFAFGVLMSIGSAAFASANWALTADLVPEEESSRYFGLANFGTAGAAAAAGLFGPLVDWTNTVNPGAGYPALFIASSVSLILSAFLLRWVDQAAPTIQPESVSV